MAQVLLENVTKIFDRDIMALKQVTLAVTDGEFMVIIGTSGCGKTTLLRLIAGLESPTAGKIVVGDTIVNGVCPRKRDVAMVFQNYALYPHMTVFENMAFSLKLRKYPKAEIKMEIEKVAELLEIKALLTRKPLTLSGGQCQRVAVGRAIVRKPKVFLFDEPLSNLDASVRLTTRTELKALHNKLKTTSIYVTHDQTEAMTLGDRICVLHNGTIQQVASPLEIYDKPANRFVAGFLGNPPMNFIEGRILYKNTQCYFTAKNSFFLLPTLIQSKLAGYRGESHVILGVRSEHFSIEPLPDQHQNCFTSSITAIEPLGNRMNVYLKTDFGSTLVANVGREANIQIGNNIEIYMDLPKAHLFTSDAIGKNITATTV